MNRNDALELVDRERDRQSAMWGGRHAWGRGDCSSHDVADIAKAAVLAEECGEVARAVLERNEPELITELVQVVAVGLAWLESL